MTVLRIRGAALPGGDVVDLFADGDQWTDDPVRGAELAAAGLRWHDALAAGSWAARSYLGLGGLTPGAPADAVVYDADPRTDLAQLDAPRAVILAAAWSTVVRQVREAGLLLAVVITAASDDRDAPAATFRARGG